MSKWSAGLIVIALALSVSWAENGAADGPNILIVDLQAVIEKCDEHADLIESEKKRADAKRKEMSDEVLKVQQEQETLLKTEPGDRMQDWYENVDKLFLAQAKLKAAEASYNLKVNDRLAKGLQALIVGAQEQARKIMRDRGAELVVISKMGPVNLATEQHFRDELINRRVLCANRKTGLDVTDDVRKAMNEAYKKRKG